MNYDEVAYISQTWGLAYMFALFVGVLIYALRPSARKKFEDAAQIPFRED